MPGEVVDHGAPPEAYVHRAKAPADPDYGIATLREVLEAFPGIYLNLDIKQTAPAVPPYEEALARLLAEFGRTDDVIVASFDDRATAAFSRHAPAVPTSAGALATAEFWRAVQAGEPAPPTRHAALQVPAAFEDITVVDRRFVDRAHEAGLAVHVWTIDEADEMARLVGLGVDGIMTDRPSALVGLLRDRGLTARR